MAWNLEGVVCRLQSISSLFRFLSQEEIYLSLKIRTHCRLFLFFFWGVMNLLGLITTPLTAQISIINCTIVFSHSINQCSTIGTLKCRHVILSKAIILNKSPSKASWFLINRRVISCQSFNAWCSWLSPSFIEHWLIYMPLAENIKNWVL
jgi:hypothetical protein